MAFYNDFMKRICSLFIAAVLAFSGCAGFLWAQENSPLKTYLVTDFAYYPKSDFVPGNTHFAPVTGPYYTIEGRTALTLDYKIPTPLGTNFLLKDANFTLGPTFELTPVSFRPKLSLSFTPVPFLIFSAGTSVASAWDFAVFKGLVVLNEENHKYESASTFKNFYYDFWASGTFQFDTGALIPGDWSHVLILSSFKVSYEAVTNIQNESIWRFQNVYKVNGLRYSGSAVLAYQMPIVLYRAGIMFEYQGYFDGTDFGKFNASYDGEFTRYDISLMGQWHLTKKDNLTTLIGFLAQRSFEQPHEKYEEEVYLTKSGTEWIFNRIAFSWTHNF